MKSHAHHDDPLLSQFYELSNSTANSFTSVSLQTRSDIECSMYGFGLFCLDAYTVHQNDGDLHFFSVRITVASQLTCGNPISEDRATSPPCNPNKMLHAVRIVTPFLPQVWVQKHQNPRCLADNPKPGAWSAKLWSKPKPIALPAFCKCSKSSPSRLHILVVSIFVFYLQSRLSFNKLTILPKNQFNIVQQKTVSMSTWEKDWAEFWEASKRIWRSKRHPECLWDLARPLESVISMALSEQLVLICTPHVLQECAAEPSSWILKCSAAREIS